MMSVFHIYGLCFSSVFKYMYHDFLADDDDWVLISLDLLPQKKTHANANGKDLLMMDYHRGLRLMMMMVRVIDHHTKGLNHNHHHHHHRHHHHLHDHHCHLAPLPWTHQAHGPPFPPISFEPRQS